MCETFLKGMGNSKMDHRGKVCEAAHDYVQWQALVLVALSSLLPVQVSKVF
jgi:hypothetical protein